MFEFYYLDKTRLIVFFFFNLEDRTRRCKYVENHYMCAICGVTSVRHPSEKRLPKETH